MVTLRSPCELQQTQQWPKWETVSTPAAMGKRCCQPFSFREVQHEAAALQRQTFPHSRLPCFSFSFLLSLCIKAQWYLFNSPFFLHAHTSKTPAWYGRSFSAWREVIRQVSSWLTQIGALGTNLIVWSLRAAQGLPFPMWAPVSTLWKA